MILKILVLVLLPFMYSFIKMLLRDVFNKLGILNTVFWVLIVAPWASVGCIVIPKKFVRLHKYCEDNKIIFED